MSLTPPTTGQGDGSIQFTIGANADPASRAAAIIVEDQRLPLAQEGRRCEFRVSSMDETVDGAGGERTIQVSAGSAQCRWSAAPDVPWITVIAGSQGSGSGAVTFRVDAVNGPPRTGVVTVAGQAVQVEQVTGCSTLSAQPHSISARPEARERFPCRPQRTAAGRPRPRPRGSRSQTPPAPVRGSSAFASLRQMDRLEPAR